MRRPILSIDRVKLSNILISAHTRVPMNGEPTPIEIRYYVGITDPEANMELKYGMNSNQRHAEFEDDENLKVLNGNPSYINFLDALNAWQLVKELQTATAVPAAASFKHVTPSGVAITKPFERNELPSYNRRSRGLSDLSTAYIKARGSDRLASFGDFVSLSDKVDVETAKVIRSEVSDGIIAPTTAYRKPKEICSTSRCGKKHIKTILF